MGRRGAASGGKKQPRDGYRSDGGAPGRGGVRMPAPLGADADRIPMPAAIDY
ncbi:hypothetical protein KF840_26715 [bacterium]|nr:hypothetical protein [bacterium]